MVEKRLDIAEVQANFDVLFEGVFDNQHYVVITIDDEPQAVIMNYDDHLKQQKLIASYGISISID